MPDPIPKGSGTVDAALFSGRSEIRYPDFESAQGSPALHSWQYAAISMQERLKRVEESVGDIKTILGHLVPKIEHVHASISHLATSADLANGLRDKVSWGRLFGFVMLLIAFGGVVAAGVLYVSNNIRVITLAGDTVAASPAPPVSQQQFAPRQLPAGHSNEIPAPADSAGGVSR